MLLFIRDLIVVIVFTGLLCLGGYAWITHHTDPAVTFQVSR